MIVVLNGFDSDYYSDEINSQSFDYVINKFANNGRHSDALHLQEAEVPVSSGSVH